MAIDMHTHPLLSYDPADAERLLKILDANHVDRIVVITRDGLRSNCMDHPAINDGIYGFCRKNPERFLPAFTINPLFGQKAVDEIRRCREKFGISLLKLHPWLQGFSLASSHMDRVAAMCRELGITIIFHDGTPPYATPCQLARLCRDFPELKIISGHAGLNDLWYDSLLSARRYQNFHICLCGVAVSQMQRIVDQVAPEQICVGSDFIDLAEDSLWYPWQQWRRVEMPDKVRDIIENKTPKKLLNI